MDNFRKLLTIIIQQRIDLTKMKKTTTLVLAFLFAAGLSAQTADATEGCASFTVKFSAPTADSYFWNFDDGASSEEQNPENVFTVPREYNVELFDTQGGTLVGSILITVYPEVEITISEDVDWGCVPLDVSFSSNIQANPAIDIQELNWTFGDGNTGITGSPMTTYERGGIFDVSVEIATNFIQCNKTVIFEDVIEAEDLTTDIVLPDEIPCTEPSTFNISSGLEEDSRYTYSWDFGSGAEPRTSSNFDPGQVTYDTFGDYEVSLTISSPSGCTVTNVTDFTIGPVEAIVNFPPRVCAGEEFTILNTTLATRWDWRWGDPLMRSFERDLTLTFDEAGVEQITLLTSSVSGCVRETLIEIEVEKPDPTFTIEPLISCSELDPKTLTANDSQLAVYEWNGTVGGSTFVLPGLSEPRDPLHINQADSVEITLAVTSAAGCTADTTLKFDFRLPEAFFIPDRIRGFESLTVNFSDLSESSTDIIRRYWIYDDGNTAEVDITEHSYTYGCGEYFPRLVIEDANGCIDTSRRIPIIVMCQDTMGGGGGGGIPDPGDGPTITSSPDSLCTGDILTFANPNGDFQFHLYADDDRLSHCWEELEFNHQFNFPGTFPSSLLIEYEGLFINEFQGSDLTIFGTRSEILYERSCENNTVSFRSNSLNAVYHEWTYNGDVISTEEAFEFTFDEPGEHEVTLSTRSGPGSCDADEDMVTIFVTDLRADFELPDADICQETPALLDASPSNDVFASCHKGFKWIFENQRPRETEDAILEHEFLGGTQDITLVVEDINGCTDSITKSTTIFGVEALFNLDSTVCLPYDKEFMDLSTSDTTLVSWDWSFGSNEQNPTIVFDETDLNPEFEGDTITVTFVAEDILGCTDTLEHHIRVVDPEFFVNSQTGSRVCIGEEVLFNAIDQGGVREEYDFIWQIDGERQATGFQVPLRFDEPGEHVVTMIAIHKNGLCEREVDFTIRVLETPQAGFTSNVDDIEILCFPAQISFTSDPSLNPNEFDFEWNFGQGDFSNLQNPTIEFGIGTHEVTQIITNSDGCQDSISMFYTLVGPTGTFTQDKDVICIGEAVTFTLGDTSNISSFTWNFGDGTEVENTNPVTHIYDFRPEGDATVVTLTIRSDDTGCDATVEAPLALANVVADIEDLGQLCRGDLNVNNNSVGNVTNNWDFGDGTSSTDANPEKIFENAGTFEIILTVGDGNCEDRDTLTLVVDEEVGIGLDMPNLFTPNGNAQNDIFGPVISNVTAEEEITVTTFRIYNRFGELVFDNDDPEGWDGIFQAETAPPEVYAYYIEIDISGCSTLSRKGSVTLMR